MNSYTGPHTMTWPVLSNQHQAKTFYWADFLFCKWINDVCLIMPLQAIVEGAYCGMGWRKSSMCVQAEIISH